MHDELTRIAQSPRPSRSLLLGVTSTAVLATAVITAIALTPTEVVAPAPLVIPISAPQLTLMPAPAIEPLEEPEPVDEPAPQPRAATPFIQAGCMLEDPENVATPCAWDRGFPAISADGKTIAIERYAEDGGRGNSGMTIEYLDVATSRVKRSTLVLDPDEYVDAQDPKSPALREKIEQRAAAAQRVLDAGGYRSLVAVGRTDDVEITGAGLRTEHEMDLLRVIDIASNTVIWQRRFDVNAEFPNRKSDPDVDACQPRATGNMIITWDPQTRTILTDVAYTAGPCFCSDTHVAYAQHVR